MMITIYLKVKFKFKISRKLAVSHSSVLISNALKLTLKMIKKSAREEISIDSCAMIISFLLFLNLQLRHEHKKITSSCAASSTEKCE